MTDQLTQLGRELPDHQPSEARREAMRTALLLEAQTIAPAAPARRGHWGVAAAVAGVAAAAAVGVFVLSSGDGGGETAAKGPAVLHRATVQSPAGAKFVHQTLPTPSDGLRDEVVKLESGRVALVVESLAPQERFRVVTKRAEVESRGATFEVEVVGDELREVAVHTGRVEIHVSGQRTIVLGSGETWKSDLSITDLDLGRADAVIDDSVAVNNALATDDSVVPIEPDRLTTAAPEPERIGGDSSIARRAPRPAPAVATRSVPAVRHKPARTAASSLPAPERAPAPRREPASAADSAPQRTTPVTDRVELAFQGAWKAMRSGKFAMAARGFAATVALDRDHEMVQDARYWRAVALARAGNKAAAGRAMRSFLALHADSSRVGEVSVMLAWIELENGQRDRAERLFATGLKDKSAKVRDSARAGLKSLGL